MLVCIDHGDFTLRRQKKDVGTRRGHVEGLTSSCRRLMAASGAGRCLSEDDGPSCQQTEVGPVIDPVAATYIHSTPVHRTEISLFLLLI